MVSWFHIEPDDLTSPERHAYERAQREREQEQLARERCRPVTENVRIIRESEEETWAEFRAEVESEKIAEEESEDYYRERGER